MSRYSITIEGKTYEVEFRERCGSHLSFTVDGIIYAVDVATAGPATSPMRATTPTTSISQGPLLIRSPIPGIVSDIKVEPGDEVRPDSVVVVIEAMKMENPIKAGRSARVQSVHVRKGEEIPAGHLLVQLEQ